MNDRVFYGKVASLFSILFFLSRYGMDGWKSRWLTWCAWSIIRSAVDGVFLFGGGAAICNPYTNRI